MTVYVDDMRARYGRMIMCHMIADTDEELHAMADSIGVSRRWHQAPPKHQSHYDIALSKKDLAVQAGAVAITMRQAAMMLRRKRTTGSLGLPEDAERWWSHDWSKRQGPSTLDEGQQTLDGGPAHNAQVGETETLSREVRQP